MLLLGFIPGALKEGATMRFKICLMGILLATLPLRADIFHAFKEIFGYRSAPDNRQATEEVAVVHVTVPDSSVTLFFNGQKVVGNPGDVKSYWLKSGNLAPVILINGSQSMQRLILRPGQRALVKYAPKDKWITVEKKELAFCFSYIDLLKAITQEFEKNSKSSIVPYSFLATNVYFDELKLVSKAAHEKIRGDYSEMTEQIIKDLGEIDPSKFLIGTDKCPGRKAELFERISAMCPSHELKREDICYQSALQFTSRGNLVAERILTDCKAVADLGKRVDCYRDTIKAVVKGVAERAKTWGIDPN